MPKEEYCVAEFSATHGSVRFRCIAHSSYVTVGLDRIEILFPDTYLVYYYASSHIPCLAYLELNGHELKGSRDYSQTPCGGATVFPDKLCKTAFLTLRTENEISGIVIIAPVLY